MRRRRGAKPIHSPARGRRDIGRHRRVAAPHGTGCRRHGRARRNPQWPLCALCAEIPRRPRPADRQDVMGRYGGFGRPARPQGVPRRARPGPAFAHGDVPCHVRGRIFAPPGRQERHGGAGVGGRRPRSRQHDLFASQAPYRAHHGRSRRKCLRRRAESRPGRDRTPRTELSGALPGQACRHHRDPPLCGLSAIRQEAVYRLPFQPCRRSAP